MLDSFAGSGVVGVAALKKEKLHINRNNEREYRKNRDTL